MQRIIGLTFLLLGLAYAQTQVGVAVLTATALNGGAVNGTVLFTYLNSTHTTVQVAITGLTQNLGVPHGIHVHQYGDISGISNGMSAGNHFDPNNAPHGCPENTDDRHLGDMGNWNVDANGAVSQTKVINLLQLTGNNSIIGLAVVVHNLTDNCINTTSAAARLAFGVIGVANVAGNTATAAPSLSTLNATCYVTKTNITSSLSSGQAFFVQNNNAVSVFIYYQAAFTSTHANHIHTYGDLRAADGSGAGGHFNPAGVNHSIPPLTPRHAGDLGNVPVDQGNGYYYISLTDGLLSLSGQKSILGHALILHNAVDDCSQPTGNSGSRIGYCVVGLAGPTSVSPTGFPNLNFAQNTSACPAAQSTTASGTTNVGDVAKIVPAVGVVLFGLLAMLF